MITITELELILFIGFVVMTGLYFKMRAEIYMHRHITGEIFVRIARGQIKVIEDGDGGFELKEVKS